MMQDVSWPAFSVASAGWILVAGFVWSMQKGKIVPRTSLDDALHDRDEWRSESRIKDQQITEKDGQLRHLAEVGETQKAVLNAITKLAEESR